MSKSKLGCVSSRPDARPLALPTGACIPADLSAPYLEHVQALPLVLRLKSDCAHARFVYAGQSLCATAHRKYKADNLPQVLIFNDGALVMQKSPAGSTMRCAWRKPEPEPDLDPDPDIGTHAHCAVPCMRTAACTACTQRADCRDVQTAGT